MNTYENAVPKPLKFLVSDGKLVDDAGNVIAESESLKDLYTKWNPEVKKYLLSDGSVVDEEGNLIIKNDYYKKIYDQADPKVAKYLHADGTIDENPGSGGGADLEDNHQTTIDVSTYTEPVEVVPESGKDGMKKATVTLSNISSGKVRFIYGWDSIFADIKYMYTFSETPSVGDKAIYGKDSSETGGEGLGVVTITAISTAGTGSITVLLNGNEVEYGRAFGLDIDLDN